MHALGGVEEGLKTQLINDYKTADITEADKLILEYAEKITKTPASITKADIDKLLANGFDKQGVHDIAQVASYYNYVNRLADSLGVELED